MARAARWRGLADARRLKRGDRGCPRFRRGRLDGTRGNLVIDLPRTWFPWTNDVLAGSDRIFVVTDMTVPGLRFARRMAQSIGEKLARAAPPKVIVNRFQTGLLFGGSLRRSDVERALGAAFAGQVANNYQVVREAIDRGVPLETVKPGNSVTTDLRRILFPQAA